MHGQRRPLLLVAMFVDALRVADLSLPTAGVLLSVGAAASIAAGPLAGAASDRVGPVRVVALANLLGLAGCASLFWWTNAWGYGVAAFLLSANMRVFWAAYTPLVTAIAAPNELERWFGSQRRARYVGLAMGQALSGLALAAGETDGLRVIVAANGFSFAVV